MNGASKLWCFIALTVLVCVGPCVVSAEPDDLAPVQNRATKPVKKTIDGNKIIDKTVGANTANSTAASAGMALVADGNGGASWSSINYNNLANTPANLATTTYVDAQIANTNASLATTNASLADTQASLASANANIASLVVQLKQIDPNNCGGTGIVCSANNVVVPVCSAGVCISPCNSGYADCNNNKQSDGCEVNLKVDPNNCGLCGTVCPSKVCANSLCQAPSCSDGVKNGGETDVDCGGGTCSPCANGKHCVVGADCSSSTCTNNVCVNPCQNGIQDGQETDVDCGGPVCSKCAVNKKCQVNADCISAACNVSSLLCVSSTCADGQQDGAETDVDCGGGTCPACALTKKCLVNTDCASNACDGISLLCVSNQCADHRQDGVETDVDCGGGVCSTCATGKKCKVGSDCTSGACNVSTLLCVSSTCADGQQDGQETDVDCGGPTCSKCASGKKCLGNSDCASGVCNTATTHTCQ